MKWLRSLKKRGSPFAEINTIDISSNFKLRFNLEGNVAEAKAIVKVSQDQQVKMGDYLLQKLIIIPVRPITFLSTIIFLPINELIIS